MRIIGITLYNLTLSLWVGGMAVFTLLVTPLIFKQWGRDMAGRIVGGLFPSYFMALTALSALALLFLLLFFGLRGGGTVAKVSMLLAGAALVVNLYTTFVLYPDIVKVKGEIESFERTPEDNPLRREFSKLHAASAILNLLVLADGVVLLVLSPYLKK